MKEISLDKLDLNIIDMLSADSRIPTNKLAKHLKKPRHVIAYRRKKLHQQGVIIGNMMMLNYSALGLEEFVVYWKFFKYLENKEKIIDFLKKLKNVRWCAEVFPKYDIRVSFITKGIEDLEETINDFEQTFSGLIQTKTILLNNEFLKIPNHSTMRKHKSLDIKDTKIDDIDKKILQFLNKNPDASLSKISHHTSQTVEGTRRRIMHLQKSIIHSVYAKISPDKINVNFWCIILIRLNNMNENMKSLISLLFSGREYGRTRRTFGEWNIELSLSVHNHKEFVHFINEIEKRFGDDFQAYEVLIYTHKIIDNNLPEYVSENM